MPVVISRTVGRTALKVLVLFAGACQVLADAEPGYYRSYGYGGYGGYGYGKREADAEPGYYRSYGYGGYGGYGYGKRDAEPGYYGSYSGYYRDDYNFSNWNL